MLADLVRRCPYRNGRMERACGWSAMTMMQTALASQQATAAGIRADLGAGPAGSKGSDTGEMSWVPGLSITLSRCGVRGTDWRRSQVVTTTPPASSSHTRA